MSNNPQSDQGSLLSVVVMWRLGPLLQLLEPPRQIVEVDVVRWGGVAADGVGGERVGDGGELREVVVVEEIRRPARACGEQRSLAYGPLAGSGRDQDY